MPNALWVMKMPSEFFNAPSFNHNNLLILGMDVPEEFPASLLAQERLHPLDSRL